MTREEAIKELTELLPEEYLSEYADAIKMGIEALEQEPCDDCISRQAALNSLMDNTHLDGYDLAEALDAIENTDKLPSVQPQPCVDMVSRDAMWEVLQRLYGTEGELVEELMSLPPVTPQPKMGRWVKTPKAIMGEGYMWYCDKCEHEVYQDSSRPYPSEKFCPNCGQPKMQEVKDE